MLLKYLVALDRYATIGRCSEEPLEALTMKKKKWTTASQQMLTLKYGPKSKTGQSVISTSILIYVSKSTDHFTLRSYLLNTWHTIYSSGHFGTLHYSIIGRRTHSTAQPHSTTVMTPLSSFLPGEPRVWGVYANTLQYNSPVHKHTRVQPTCTQHIFCLICRHGILNESPDNTKRNRSHVYELIIMLYRTKLRNDKKYFLLYIVAAV